MMTLNEAKELLKDSIRYELRDHAFGDREVTWVIGERLIAAGYFSGSTSEVYITPHTEDIVSDKFFGIEAEILLSYGYLKVERNDETGPDSYEDGKIMEGLTLEGVRKELEK